MDTGRRIVRSSFRQALGFAGGSALIFLTFVLIARALGVADFGRFSLILSVASVFQLVADMGVRNVVIRDLAVERALLGARLGVMRLLLLVFSLLSLALMVAGAHLADLTPEVRQATYLAGAAVMTTFHALGFSAVLRAFEEMDADILGFVGHKALFLVFAALAMRLGLGLRGAVAALLLANIALYLFYRLLVGRRHGIVPMGRDARAAWALLRKAAPLGVAEILRRLSWQVDRMVLALLNTPAAVGLFSTAYKFIEGMQPLLGQVALPLFPVFARLASSGPARVFEAHERSLKFLFAAGAPVAVVLVVLPERLLTLCFGAEFRAAVPAMTLLGPVMLLLPASALYPFLFTALGAQRLYTLAAGLGLAVNLLLDVALVPRYGAGGAALATLTAESVLFLAGAFLLKRIGARSLGLGACWRPAVAALAMAAVCAGIRSAPLALLLAGLVLALAVYLGALLLLRTFTLDELAAMREAVLLRPAA